MATSVPFAKPDAARLPVVAVSSRFGKYEPEDEKDVRKVEVKENEVLRQLKAAWKRFDHGERPVTWKSFDHGERPLKENYSKASSAVEGLDYSAKDVENFCIALAEFQDEILFSTKAGVFLSALINNGKDTDYVIHTEHMRQPLDNIGYCNTKNITINGNVGGTVACRMQNGTITINGRAGHSLGAHMSGGTIIVNGDTRGMAGLGLDDGEIIINGDAGAHIGLGMNGGRITVNGNAGEIIGSEMKGGEVHLEGDYRGLSESILGGKIYHKGVLIVEDGKEIKRN